VSTPGTRYVANADQPFVQACIDAGEGRTSCGTEMGSRFAPWALWIPVVLRPGDRVCARCRGADVTGTQEALL
jgi:hypothetical protein